MTREELYDSIVQRCNENVYKLVGSNMQKIERLKIGRYTVVIRKLEFDDRFGLIFESYQRIPEEIIELLNDILKYMNWDETDAN